MPPSRLVLFHPDPLRLEEELARRVSDVKREAGPWARVLVTAPTQRLVLRLREQLAARNGALCNIEVLQYQALAYRLLESSDAVPPILLSEPVLERLLDRILARHPNFALATYARERPAALAELRARIQELREAGVSASDLGLPEVPAGAQTTLFPADRPDGLLDEVCVTLDAFDNALESLEARGWTDRPGLARRAAREPSPDYEAVFAYGAYEIVGVHLELLGTLHAARPMTFFVPADLEAPAWAHAREQAERFFGGRLEALPDAASGPRDFVSRARRLHDGADPSTEAAPIPITLAHAQGPEAELNHAARRVLALVRDGVPLREIAVIGRTLEPYTAPAESVFARHRLPVDASASLPLARYPEPRAVLLLLRVLSENFERRAVAELVRSPHLVHPEWVRENALWRPVAWERWSRTYGITGGLESWTVELPRLLRQRTPPPWMEDAAQISDLLARREEEARSAELLGRLVGEWGALLERWSSCRSASEHASFLETLRGTWIRRLPETRSAPESTTLDRVWDGALDQLRALADIQNISPGPAAGLDRETVLEFVTTALQAATVSAGNPEGLAFLDMRQARGLPFRHVFMIGFNDGLYPQPPRETPLLPDRVRRAVRDRTGKPLAVRREGRKEERLLLAQLVASTRDTLTVSWQRADAEGRALAPTLALRELARILPGSPSLTRLFEDNAPGTKALPTEPTLAAAWLREECGLLLREEAALLSARTAPSPAQGLRIFLDAADPDLGRTLAPGIALVLATETADDLAYDGAIELASPWARPYSAYSLQDLARCPLTFFFRNVLEARPLDEEAREHRIEAREIGQLVHRVLEQVYTDLAGLLDGTTGWVALQEAGRSALEARWTEALSPLSQRMGRRYPLLYETTARIWKTELMRFLEKDLARLVEGGHRLESLERALSVTLPLGSGASDGLQITGVPDRITRDRDGRLWISDYKTSGKLEKYTQPNRYLRGEYVQLPLYILLAMSGGESAPIPEAEVLGLGPKFFPRFGFVGRGPHRLDPGEFKDGAGGFTETLGVLGDLVARGRFPFRSDHHCRFCHFHLACRRHHNSTGLRVEEHPDHDAYFRMKEKSKKNPMLKTLVANEEETS